jgi:predicted aspartyl protease
MLIANLLPPSYSLVDNGIDLRLGCGAPRFQDRSEQSEEQHVERFSVSYVMQRSKYMVATTINGRELLMRLDTGCKRCIVPIAFLDQLGLEKPNRAPDARYKRTGSAIWKITADVQLGPLVRREMVIDVFDGELWPGSPVLGNSFFEGYRRLVRSSRSEVHFFHESLDRTVDLDLTGSCVLPFVKDKQRGTPIVEAVVNGCSAPVLFDTGANDALWLTTEQAARFNIENRGTEIAVGKSRVRCVKTHIPSLQIGELHLLNIKTMIFDKAEATWATDYICFGTALLAEYDYFIDDRSGLIHIFGVGEAAS